MRFSGKDFAELSEAWGVEKESEFISDQTMLDGIEEHIWDSFDEETQKIDTDTREDMMRFLTMLESQSKKHTYEWPMWSAMQRISDDYTLCQFFCRLLPFMWV